MCAHFLGWIQRDRFAQSPSFRAKSHCRFRPVRPPVRLLHVGRSLFIGLIRVGRTDDDERRPRSRVCASGPSLRLMCVREVTDGIICRAYFSLMLG